MVRFQFIFAMLLLLSGPVMLSAEDTAVTETEISEQTPDQENVKGEQESPGSSDTFTPSEEISEDFSVPFPADI